MTSDIETNVTSLAHLLSRNLVVLPADPFSRRARNVSSTIAATSANAALNPKPLLAAEQIQQTTETKSTLHGKPRGSKYPIIRYLGFR